MRGNKDDSRDYVPNRETDLKARMEKGASLNDGLAGRTAVQKPNPHYRKKTVKGESADDCCILYPGEW